MFDFDALPEELQWKIAYYCTHQIGTLQFVMEDKVFSDLSFGVCNHRIVANRMMGCKISSHRVVATLMDIKDYGVNLDNWPYTFAWTTPCEIEYYISTENEIVVREPWGDFTVVGRHGFFMLYKYGCLAPVAKRFARTRTIMNAVFDKNVILSGATSNEWGDFSDLMLNIMTMRQVFQLRVNILLRILSLIRKRNQLRS